MIIPIGHENFIQIEKVVAILSAEDSRARKLRQAAEESRTLIDATSGRATRSIILLTDNHVVLSSLQPEAIRRRFRAFMKSLEKDRKTD